MDKRGETPEFDPTWFMITLPKSLRNIHPNDFVPIRKVVEWSRTPSVDGEFDTPQDLVGCMRWGMCESRYEKAAPEGNETLTEEALAIQKLLITGE